MCKEMLGKSSMSKDDFLGLGFMQLTGNEELETLYKEYEKVDDMFDIVQFNSQGEQLGHVYLHKEQMEKLLK